MALKATIFKAELDVSDIDRGYYQTHTLTIARHPSETDERMMVRVLAFALHAHEQLDFGRGLSTDDEPDLWQRDLTGAIRLWVDVGLPDERRLRKASGRSGAVVVYAYGGRGTGIWWRQTGPDVARLRNLTVKTLAPATSQALAKLAERNMRLQCTVQEGQVWLGNAAGGVTLEPEVLQQGT